MVPSEFKVCRGPHISNKNCNTPTGFRKTLPKAHRFQKNIAKVFHSKGIMTTYTDQQSCSIQFFARTGAHKECLSFQQEYLHWIAQNSILFDYITISMGCERIMHKSSFFFHLFHHLYYQGHVASH